MNSIKSNIEVKEGKKRVLFVLKFVGYLFLVFILEYVDFNSNALQLKFYHFLNALAFLLGGNLLVSMGRIILVRFYLRKKQADPLHSNFVLGINRIASMVNVIIFLIALMIFFDIEPLKFLSSITIVAAAIALLSKDYITNMLNGLIIMFSDQITLGDHILVAENRGKIQDITLLNVVLLNEDDDLIMVPNSLLLSSQVINYSRQNVKKFTFEFEIKSRSGLNIDLIENNLKKEFQSFGNQINNNSLVLKTIWIQKETIKLKLQVRLNTTTKEAERKIRRKINQSLIDLSNEGK